MRSLTFTNDGAEPVVIESLVLGGPSAGAFAIVSDTEEPALSPGEDRTVTVSFAPALVGRFGAALVLATDADAHPVAVGLAGRGVDDPYESPAHVFALVGRHAVMEVPSRFGTDYSLTRATEPGNPTPPRLFTVPGTGRTLYLTDPEVVDHLPRAFYRVLAERGE